MHLSVILSNLLALLLLVPESSHGQYLAYTKKIEKIIWENLGKDISLDAFIRYEQLKRENGYKVLLAQRINETEAEAEEGEVEVTVD
eukprot:13452942-Ditylum_brightwellii.AAC.1